MIRIIWDCMGEAGFVWEYTGLLLYIIRWGSWTAKRSFEIHIRTR